MTTYLDTTKRQLFELRFESVAQGTDPSALLEWHRAAARPGGLRERYQVPAPEGVWAIAIGRNAPAAVSLYRWESLTRREETLGRLLADDAAGGRALAGLVRRTESWVLIDSPFFRSTMGTQPLPADAICELRVQRVLNGAAREAAEALVDIEFAAVAAKGGQVLGLYELAIGHHRPTLISFTAWPASVSPHLAWAETDNSAVLAARRLGERAQYRRRLFAETEQFLLRPVSGLGAALNSASMV